ncbi:hypothetical protein [Falsibacillus pallidus]|uniref:hypothetical protein n=1 Tax=Falsibacillus pallidus TaxID=493781 RepID=UPI003D99DA7C
MIVRKFTATFFTTSLLSLILAGTYLSFSVFSPNTGDHLLGWSLFYGIYIGAIILFYGNLVSFFIEWLQGKWDWITQWFYILLHGVFGLANGLLFESWMLGFEGAIAAIVYAAIDRWVYFRQKKDKGMGIKLFYIFPIAVYLLSWGVLELASPSEPPFTKNDAAAFAVQGEGTIENTFPDHIGKWEGTIKGFKVTKETAVREIGKETYMVVFTERWEKGLLKGTRSMYYQVERGTLSGRGQEGNDPPYN